MVASVVLPISFSVSASEKPTATAADVPTATDTLAATSRAVIDELSTAITATEPSAITVLPFTIEASTSLVMTFLAHAPAPEIPTPTLVARRHADGGGNGHGVDGVVGQRRDGHVAARGCDLGGC